MHIRGTSRFLDAVESACRRVAMTRLGFFVFAALLLSTVPALTQPPLPEPTETATKGIVASRLKQLNENTQLDEAEKLKARASYEQALRDLEKIAGNAAFVERFEQQSATAAEELAKAKQRLTDVRRPAAEALPVAVDATLVELEHELTKRESALKEKTESLARLDAEPKRRAARLEEIPKTIKEFRQELAELEKTLIAAGEASAVSLASRTAFLVRKELLLGTVPMLEKERAAYEATTEVLQVERDIAAAEFSDVESAVNRWRKRVNERRKTETDNQAREARRAALGAKPQLAVLAEEIKKLTQKRQDLATDIEKLADELDTSRKLLSSVSKDFERSKEKVDAVGLSHESGQLLRGERAELPDLRRYHRDTAARGTLRQKALFNLYEYQNKRFDLANLEDSVDALATELNETSDDTKAQIRELLQLKKDYLKGLIGDSESYAKTLLQLNGIERQLIDVTEEYAGFIDERVLWIRSTFVLSYEDVSPCYRRFTLDRIAKQLG